MKTTLNGIYYYPAGKGNFLGRGNSCNVFLIEQNDHKVMIDAGISTGGKPKELEQQILQDGHSFHEIQTILITHGHADHINGLRYFVKKYPHLAVWCSKDEIPLLVKGDELKNRVKIAGRNLLNRIYPAPFPIVKMVALFIDGKYIRNPVHKSFNDGEIIGDESNSIKAISTPGHTEGHVSYYLPGEKVLFSGDLLDPRYSDQPILNNANANFGEMYESLVKIRDLEIYSLMPSHGGLIQVPNDVPKNHIQRAILNMENAAINLFELLKNGESKFEKLFQTIDKTIWPPFFNKSMAYSILRFLENRGIVKYEPFNKEFRLDNTSIKDLDNLKSIITYKTWKT